MKLRKLFASIALMTTLTIGVGFGIAGNHKKEIKPVEAASQTVKYGVFVKTGWEGTQYAALSFNSTTGMWTGSGIIPANTNFYVYAYGSNKGDRQIGYCGESGGGLSNVSYISHDSSRTGAIHTTAKASFSFSLSDADISSYGDVEWIWQTNSSITGTAVYTVTFNANGHGTAPDSQDIVSGGKVTEPTAPTASGYTFGGWYKEAGCTNAWNFSTDTVTSNKTLYAKWTRTQYTVTKYKVMDGGSPVQISSEQVDSGASYAVPANRYEAGYTFDGWYTTSACTTKYTAKTINANTQIYAKYTSHAAWTGTISVDLWTSGWADTAGKYAIMLMDKTTYDPVEVDGWSNFVTGISSGVKLINFSYSLPFQPLTMTIVKFNTSASEPDWDEMVSQTYDISVNNMIRISDVHSGKKYDSYDGFPKVMGGDPWAQKGYLSSVKLNGSNNAEYYGNITLAENEKFNILRAPYNSETDYGATYSTHPAIASYFQDGGAGSIQAKVAGTYSVYFDNVTKNTYITSVAAAEADEWAQFFLNNVGCDSTGRLAPTGWSTCASEYNDLSDDAKDIVYGATARIDGGYVEKAVYWYDYAVRAHPSLTRFIVDSDEHVRAVTANTSAILSRISINSSNAAIIVIIVSMIGVASLGGYFFFKKNKHEND